MVTQRLWSDTLLPSSSLPPSSPLLSGSDALSDAFDFAGVPVDTDEESRGRGRKAGSRERRPVLGGTKDGTANVLGTPRTRRCG
jgi:hypothetical protein